MVDNSPEIPFSAYNTEPQQPARPELSPEVIKQRLDSINNFMNTYQPGILQALNESQQKQAEFISRARLADRTPPIESLPKIQDLVSGNVMSGPNPGGKPVNIPNFNYVNTLLEKNKIEAASLKDPYKFNKPIAFNATSAQYNFDRFYSHDKFKDLGFSIYRDNESIYNANSTWSDDFGRMSSKWLGLAGQGGLGLFKNWGQFGLAGEMRDAAQMEHDLGVATSSKKGAGAWFTNFAANSAYTMGIIGEIAAEEIALWGATALTGGATSPLAALRTGSNMARLGKSFKIMAQTLNKADEAKKFWTGVKGAATSIGKSFIPFDETMAVGKQMLNANSAFNRLSDFAKTQKTFGAFYRDMRAINAVTAESRLEGGFVHNKVANDALAEFYKKEKRAPNAQEAKLISDKAFQAGKTTTLANIPAIYFSNKLVMDGIFKGIKPIRRILNQDALKSNLFKIKDVNGVMSVVSKGLLPSMKRTFSKDFLKNIPSTLKGTFSARTAGRAFGGGLRYFKANLAEGLQELYQEGAQVAVSDYYLQEYYADLHKDPFLAGKNSVSESIYKGVNEMMGAQGIDVFAQGFLMGGLVGRITNPIMSITQRVGMYAKGGEGYKKYVAEEKERLEKYASAVNDYRKNGLEYTFWLDQNVARQRDLADKYDRAEAEGNRVEAENAKDDSMFSHVQTLLQLGDGHYDAFVDHLEDLRDLSDQDLADGFSKLDEDIDENTKTPRQRLERAIEKAKNIKLRYDKVNEKFENPYNPDMFDKEKDKDAYIAELIGYQTFEEAKGMVIFNEYTFDRTIERLESLANKAALSGPLGATAAMEFSPLYGDFPKMLQFATLLESEYEALNQGTPEQKKLAAQKKAQLDKFMTLQTKMTDYRSKLRQIELAKQALINPEKASEESKTALEELKKLALTYAPSLNLDINDVDPLTGQMNMLFSEDVFDKIAPDVIVEQYVKEELFKAYSEYTKHIANVNDTFAIKESLEKSFGDLVDFVKLHSEARSMATFADILADPMSVFNMHRRMYDARMLAEENSEKAHKEALMNFKNNIIDVNDLLQKLMDIGVYFAPEFINDFRQNGKLPDYFIDATNGNRITPSDPRYAQIIKIIEDEEKARGVTFSNKPAAPPPPPTPPPPPPPAPGAPAAPAGGGTTAGGQTISSYPPDLQQLLRDAAVAEGYELANIDDFIKNSSKAFEIIKAYQDGLAAQSTVNLITVANPRSITPQLLTQLAPLVEEYEREQWSLPNEDSKEYVGKSGKRVRRATTLLGDEYTPSERLTGQQNRGKVIDNVLRNFFDPKIDSANNIIDISIRDQVINLILQNKIKEAKDFITTWLNSGTLDKYLVKYNMVATSDFKTNLSSALYTIANNLKDHKIVSSFPTMVGKISTGEEVGGTVDLLLEDKNGNLFIVDIKTSETGRKGKDDIIIKDQVQQNVYREIIEDKTGVKVKGIFTVQMTVDLKSDNQTMMNLKLITDGAGKILDPVDILPVKDALAKKKGAATPVKYVIAEDKNLGFTLVTEDRSDYWTDENGNVFWTKDRSAIEQKLKEVNEGSLGFGNLGNIGNQGLAAMEADINKTGRFTINISKATPEQRQKIDADIEELKKKYPEKNITSRIEGDKLIVESGVAAPVSDVEAEKQKITPSEFKELVRLAKFFLENPKEPSVAGSIIAKYPELFKAVTDIEKNKKADLEQLKTISPGNYIKIKGDSKELLKKFREYLTDVLGWDRMRIGFSNGNLTLDYLEGELKIPASVNILAGDTAILDINVEDVIEAKYNAELDALEGAKPEAPISDIKDLKVGTKLEGEDYTYTVIGFNEKGAPKVERVDKQTGAKSTTIIGVDRLNEYFKEGRLKIIKEEGKPDTGNLEETTDTDTKVEPLLSDFVGKVIYMSPGIGKTTFIEKAKAQGIQIVDADDLLAQAIIKEGFKPEDYDFPANTVVTGRTLGTVMEILYGKGHATKLEKIYNNVFIQMRGLANKGVTVLTGSARYAESSDVAFLYGPQAPRLEPSMMVKVAPLTEEDKKKGDTSIQSRAERRSREIKALEAKADPKKVIIVNNMNAFAEQLLTKKPGKPKANTLYKNLESKNLTENTLDNHIIKYNSNPALYTKVDESGYERMVSREEFAELVKKAAERSKASQSFIDSINKRLGITSTTTITADEANNIKNNVADNTIDPSIIEAMRKAKEAGKNGDTGSNNNFNDESKDDNCEL